MKKTECTTIVGSTLILPIGILVYTGFGQLATQVENRVEVVGESGVSGQLFWQTTWFQ